MRLFSVLVFLLALLSSDDIDAAFQEGQSLASGEPQHVASIESTGISANENPAETQYGDDTKIGGAVERGQRTNEAFQMIKAGNETRESYSIDVEMPTFSESVAATGNAVDGALGRGTSATHTSGETVYKTCLKSGESYTKTCRRQRMVEIRIIPEVIANHPRTCPGHMVSRSQWHGGENGDYTCWESEDFCNPGCTGGAAYVSQEKSIEFTRDDWAGCEELERLHDLGQAEVVSEVMGPFNQTRMIDGEPITKDYWETTRTYVLNTDTVNECEKLKALGCVQQDSVCEEYINGMGSARVCKRYKLTYACQTTRDTAVANRSQLGLTLPPPQTALSNQNMYAALSQMEAMRQMAKHMEGNEHSLRIFRGQDNRCSINFGGAFKNCCTSDGGVGTRMHIATTCTADEKKLVAARAKNLCIFVGSRVKKKVLGVVVSKESVFCCYPTKLGFAIQRGARAQLGRDFGSAEQPRCEGLTPDELSRVDFSRIDLSDTFADIAASAQKMERELKRDMTQKQRQFERPAALTSAKTNQPLHKRVDAQGETHDIVY